MLVIDGRLETVLSLKDAAHDESIAFSCDHCLNNAELSTRIADNSMTPDVILLRVPWDTDQLIELFMTMKTYLNRRSIPVILWARKLPISLMNASFFHSITACMLTPVTAGDYRIFIKWISALLNCGDGGPSKIIHESNPCHSD